MGSVVRGLERMDAGEAMEAFVPPGWATAEDWNHVMESTWAEPGWAQLAEQVEADGFLPRPVRVTRDGLWEVLDDDGRRLLVAAARADVEVYVVEDDDHAG